MLILYRTNLILKFILKNFLKFITTMKKNIPIIVQRPNFSKSHFSDRNSENNRNRNKNKKNWGAIGFLFLFFFTSMASSDQLNLHDRPFFDHQRIAEYVGQLESRLKKEPDNTAIAIKMYKVYFLAEKFYKAISTIDKIKKMYAKQRFVQISQWMALELDEIRSYLYSYQFSKANVLIQQFLVKYQYENPELLQQLRAIQPKILASSQLPQKKGDGSDSLWVFDSKVLRDVPLPVDDVLFSLDNKAYFVKRKKKWYSSIVSTFSFQKWQSDQEKKWHALSWIAPILGKNFFFFHKGKEIFLSHPDMSSQDKNQRIKEVPKRKKIVQKNTLVWSGSPSGLSCQRPYIAPETNFLIVSCKKNYEKAPYDLYFKRLFTNKSKEGKIMRLAISSQGDDINPFVSPDGRFLFFASDGHPGYGGFDLFSVKISYKKDQLDDAPENKTGQKTKKNKGHLNGSFLPVFDAKVENLGPKYNSFRDEKKLAGIATGKTTYLLQYFYTPQNGLGLYKAKLPRGYVTAQIEPILILVYNKDNKREISADVSLIPQDKKDVRRKRVFQTQRNEKGKLLFVQQDTQYFLRIEKKGYLYHFDELQKDQKVIRVYLRPIKVGETLTAKGILFKPNSSAMKPEAYEAANAIAGLLKKNPRLRIRLEGHTSSFGGNMPQHIINAAVRISENRAYSVKKYLTSKGVYPKRMAIKGFGPQQPLPGLPPQDSRNRRTDVRVIDINWDPSKEVNPNVAFVNFSPKNKTDYAFWGRSIPDALHTSMRDTGYVYKLVPRDKWGSYLSDVDQGRLQRFCEVTGTEILIHGQFDVQENSVTIYPEIYVLNKNKNLKLPMVKAENAPDIFLHIDEIAKEISKKLDAFTRKK